MKNKKDITEELYNLLCSIGEVNTGDMHIIDTTDRYPVEGEGSFRVYHKDGYCFDVSKVVDTEDEETGKVTFYFDYYEEWEGYNNDLTEEGALGLIKNNAPAKSKRKPKPVQVAALVKRFYVEKPMNGGPCFEADTTAEIYEYLKANPAILDHTIGCRKDNINWITDKEFMQAFDEGERPLDLQFF